MFWVYVLENPSGKFYIGQTSNLANRMVDHNRTDCFEGHFARKNGPWKLVWSEVHSSRSSAVKREREIKRMKSAKWIRTELLGKTVELTAFLFSDHRGFSDRGRPAIPWGLPEAAQSGGD
jgi:putative endonuclease